MARPTGRPVRDELITAATELIARKGVGGFSYGVLAKQLGIKAPSIHHHFATKEDLIAEVASNYRQTFSAAVESIPGGTFVERLAQYSRLFGETAKHDKLCLCGAVSADWLAVGDKSREQVKLFFEEQRSWLETELRQGVGSGAIRAVLPVETLAVTILAALEGSVLISRSTNGAELPVDVVALLGSLIEQDTRP